MGVWWWRPTGILLQRMATAALVPPSPHRTSVATYYTIQALPREYTGRRLAARERTMGRIPAVVFTRGDGKGGYGESGPVSRKLLLTTSEKQIKSLMKRVPSFCATTFALKVRAGSGSSLVLHSGSVLPIKVHRNEETGKILNLVLQWVEKGSEIKVDIPIVYKGEDVCPGLQKGGYLHKMRTTLRYLCPADNIPSTIEVDLSTRDIGDKVLPEDVPVHSSLKRLIKDEKTPICKLVVARPKESVMVSTETPELTQV